MAIKRTLIVCFMLTMVQALTAQEVEIRERRVMVLPDIPGYTTLVCDLHLHTVFSDGYVWPTVRVDEAWREGLDAIAITDHLEYLKHKEDIRTDHNRAWQIAREYAADKDVIVIAGTEITKGMPPGHFNALFIKDATPMLNKDYTIAIGEAAGQGAFIMWNHPGWKAQQPDTMKWWDAHTWLYEKGWLHGIEVANSGEHYPEAVNWAKARNLTIMGSSDEHDPFQIRTPTAEDHRTCTFVFAAERSEGGIREALFNGRTAAYTDNLVIGKRSLLEALFLQSVQLISINGDQTVYTLKNRTDLAFELVLEDRIYADWELRISLKPQYEASFILQPETARDEIRIQVENFITGTDQHLDVPMSGLSIVEKSFPGE
ncbi:MAG: PHP domain-containing protein [Bacteroidales bacterium]|nr:PHP domain-containing protein [Bacteroidales bacterium]